ncbi:MAG TPA: hypothetical protein DCF33_13965 [Saprospirales bacterium]|nr:hypothetical protein [Saprospirales bacterium]
MSLDYAADINLLLARLRLKDHQADDPVLPWRWMEKWFRNPFEKIRPMLQKWQVDESLVQSWLDDNQRREVNTAPSNVGNWASALEYYSAPTAKITAYFFSHGGKVAGQPASAPAMQDLGHAFGTLIYVLDAVTDLQEDQESGQFNPLSAYFGQGMTKEETLAVTKDHVWTLTAGVEEAIRRLPIDEGFQQALCGRLMFNVARVLSPAERSCPSAIRSGIEKSTLPRIARGLRWIIPSFNPAYPGKFAVTYLVLLGIFFSEQLRSAVLRVVEQEQGGADLTMLLAAISAPAFAYFMAKRIRKDRLLARLKKLRNKLKKKIAKWKDEPDANKLLIAILLILVIVLLVAVAIITNNTVECCAACCESASSNANTCECSG